MTFLLPWALLGLLGVPLLLWWERRRRRPAVTVWPSLLLLADLPADESARRRRIEPLLLLECAAVVLLSLAAAGPVVRAGGAGPRVTVLLDTAPAMRARRSDGRTALEATRDELARLRAALPDGTDWRVVETAGDLRAAAAALDPSGVRVVASARPGVEGPGWWTIGRAPDGRNTGLDAVRVEGDTLGFAVATDGAPRTVRVRIGEVVRTVPTGRWIEAPRAARLALLDGGNLALDDAVDLRPVRLRVRDATGSARVAAALFRAGTPAGPAGSGERADLVVRPPAPGTGRVIDRLSGRACVPGPGPFEGLLLDACLWRGVRTVPEAGRPLLRAGDDVVAAWADPEERVLVLGLPLDTEWDGYGTLAVLLERVKRRCADALAGPGEERVGDAVASPAPGLVDTRGVDRPWDGTVPAVPAPAGDAPGRALARPFAAAAALALAAWVALFVRRRRARESGR